MTKKPRIAFAMLGVAVGLVCLSGQGCPPVPIDGATDGGLSNWWSLFSSLFEKYVPKVSTYRTSYRTYFNESVLQTLVCEGNPGEYAFYTIGGSIPSRTNGQRYTEPILIENDMVVKYIVCEDGCEDSDVVTRVFTKYTGLPESPHPYPAGEYIDWVYTAAVGGHLLITFDERTDLAADTTLFVDGVEEAEDNAPFASFHGNELAGRTLRRSTECEHVDIVLDSTGTAASWGFKVARIEQAVPTPRICVGGADDVYMVTFNESIQLTVPPLGCSRPEDAVVRFTTDGTTPGAEHGATYTGPIEISETTVLKAVGCQPGVPDSLVVTGYFSKSLAYPESSHPYTIAWPAEHVEQRRPIFDYYWFYRVTGRPQSIALTFDQASELASTDQLTVLGVTRLGDEAIHLTEVADGTFSGAQMAGRIAEIPGDTVVLRLRANTYSSSATGASAGNNAEERKWGFRVTDVRAAGPGAPITQPGGTGGTSSVADRVIELVNEARAKEGLNPLRESALLAQVAATYAARMAERGFFSHTDRDTGAGPGERASDAGYLLSYLAENIAAGQPTPELVVADWLDSWGHRANILSEYVTEIGVGVYEGGEYGIYWVSAHQSHRAPWPGRVIRGAVSLCSVIGAGCAGGRRGDTACGRRDRGVRRPGTPEWLRGAPGAKCRGGARRGQCLRPAGDRERP